MFFERTRPAPQLLATLRSRRVCLGYSIESGEPETRASGRTLVQERGPLSFKSEHGTVPLSELEEALVAWPVCGPNGMAHWDIAVHGGFHELVTIAGRTAAAPGNSFAHDLLIIKDDGAFIYNPGSERSKMVEIEGERDYGKVLDWYRGGMSKVHDGRPDIDWGLRAVGAPNASLFGPYQFNLNREGQTWFIPITEPPAPDLRADSQREQEWQRDGDAVGADGAGVQPAGDPLGFDPRGLDDLPVGEREGAVAAGEEDVAAHADAAVLEAAVAEASQRSLDARLLGQLAAGGLLGDLSDPRDTAEGDVPAAWPDVLPVGPPMDEEPAVSAEDQDVDGPMPQVAPPHLPPGHHADDATGLVQLLDRFVSRRHTRSVDGSSTMSG
jgi:hypothetical protein